MSCAWKCVVDTISSASVGTMDVSTSLANVGRRLQTQSHPFFKPTNRAMDLTVRVRGGGDGLSDVSRGRIRGAGGGGGAWRLLDSYVPPHLVQQVRDHDPYVREALRGAIPFLHRDRVSRSPGASIRLILGEVQISNVLCVEMRG